MTEPWLHIVGIGEDGWDGLSPAARQAVIGAEVLYGGARHLAFIPAEETAAMRAAWPSPMSEGVETLLEEHRRRTKVTVLASGDPMLYGVGVMLAGALDSAEYKVIPQVSAFALACSRMGWPVAGTTLLSFVARPLETLHQALAPGQRLVLYSEDGTTPARAAALFTSAGYGDSLFHVFEELGGPRERGISAQASCFPAEPFGRLNLVAVRCVAGPSAQTLARVPGLPNDAFQSDGQLTKREVRAATLARLMPLPGQHLWDVGAGTGTVGIEWLRTDPACSATAFEVRASRAANIRANAAQLGVPSLQVIEGRVPETLSQVAETPDAIFVGGGLTVPGVFEECWRRLREGGRLVANAVTLESEAFLIAARARYGGDLTRIQIAHAEPLGETMIWRQAMPVVQWTVTKR